MDDPLRRLIDAVPRATLAEIIHEMLAAEPAKRRPGRPRKPSRARGRPRKPPAGNGADPGETPPALSVRARRAAVKEKTIDKAEPAAKALWAEAAALSDAPWKLVAERLGINPAVAVDAYRHHRLPPSKPARNSITKLRS